MKPSKNLLTFCKTMAKARQQYSRLSMTDKAIVEAKFARFMGEINRCRLENDQNDMLHVSNYDCLLTLADHFPSCVFWGNTEEQ